SIRKVGDPHDPGNYRDQDGDGDEFCEMFEMEPSFPDGLFEDPYGQSGKLSWIAHRNDALPLSKGVQDQDVAAVRSLLEDAGGLEEKKVLLAEAYHPETGEAPIHIAAATCQLDMLTLLIESGADPNALDSQGWSPIMYLAWFSAEPQRTGRISADVIRACVDTLCHAGADPCQFSKLQPTPSVSAKIHDWYGNSIVWASLAWNWAFLRAVLPILPGPIPFRQPDLQPSLAMKQEKPGLVETSLYPFGRRRGEPRRLIIRSRRDPFDRPCPSGAYSWDFTGSRLVQAVALDDEAELSRYPANDDIAYHNITEWEKTLDTLIDGGAQYELLDKLWRGPGTIALPARVALKLLDAGQVDVCKSIQAPHRTWNGGNGGDLAARLVEAELCAAFQETVPLLRGIQDRGAEVAMAKLSPDFSRSPYDGYMPLEPPLLRLMSKAAMRKSDLMTPLHDQYASSEEKSLAAKERHRIMEAVRFQDVPILALAIGTLDVELIDYLFEIGASTQAPRDAQWSDFLPDPERGTPDIFGRAFCNHLLPSTTIQSHLKSIYQERWKATRTRMEEQGLI
ncbi:hypothetical protein OC846_006549, partial [Tilletia horrida]